MTPVTKSQPGAKTCRTCGAILQVRQTQKKASQLQKEYYYTAYYFCPFCQKIYHDDQFKVVNKVKMEPLFAKPLYPAEDTLSVWTDGACSYNGTPRAKAAWAFVSGDHEENGMVMGKQTNNTAEAYAIYHALVWAATRDKKHIIVHSDSQISLNNMTKPIERIKENREIFQKIFSVIKEHNLSVTFEKVLGHSGDENNERADKLANGLVGIR